MSNSTVIFLTKDLFFVPMLKQAAERAGHILTVAPSIGNPRLDAIVAADVAACIVDLTAIEVDEIGSVQRQLKERFAQATLAAFGPHVRERHLQTASDSGFDHVLTRGQLNKNLDHWIGVWTRVSHSGGSNP